MTKATRFLIVGSGVAGGLIAESLLRRGLGPVVMLEAGSMVKMRHRRHWLDYLMAGRLPYDDAGDRAEDFDAAGAHSWRIEGGRLFARGGSTLHWGGWCPRMKPEDFRLATNVGRGGLDWPFSYDDLEPYYTRAEHYLQVAGDSNAQDPPRKGAYPFEAPPFSRMDGEMIAALDKLGVSHAHMPIARNGRPINGMSACMTTGTCEYCPVGGRFTGDQPLDRLQTRKQFTLQLDAPVLRVMTDGKKRATGVEYLEKSSGKRQRLEAEQVILCAGALETPKLLLASANRDWPQGIGNQSDHVGRHLIANPYFYARGLAKRNPERLQEEVWFAMLCSRHWDRPEHQREGKFILNRGTAPDLGLGKLMGQGKTAALIAQAAEGERVIELQGALQIFSHRENRVALAKGTTRFDLPRTRIEAPVAAFSPERAAAIQSRMRQVLETMGYEPLPGDAGLGAYPQRGDHAQCSCRMSASPEHGVVDPDLKVHGMDNLHIVSNAVFPSGSAANPTLTLAALALRFAERWDGERGPTVKGSPPDEDLR